MLELRSYQTKAVNYILEKKRCGLFLDMGLGKTIICLSTIKKLLEQNKILKCLIIAPKQVAKHVWSDEIEKWNLDLSYSICLGTPKQKKEALLKKADIYITNRDNVKWMCDNGNSKFGCIIVDESSSFKSHKSIRFKNLKKFISKYMVLLTGTPMPKSYLDLWSQIYLIDKGNRLFANFYHYRNFYFYSFNGGFSWKCRNSNSILQAIKDVTLTLSEKDYLNLPDKINTYSKIELPNYKDYRKLESNYFMEIEDSEITTFNAGVLTNKLLQFCNGAVYDEEKNIVPIHNEKITALESILEDNSNDNVIVAYNYKHDLIRLKNHFKEAEELNDDTYSKWNDGKIKLLLVNPAKSSMGLNLQTGGNIIIWFGLTWNLEHYLQFNKRLHRPGQTKPVIISHIICENTIENKLVKALNFKNMNQQKLFEYLK